MIKFVMGVLQQPPPQGYLLVSMNLIGILAQTGAAIFASRPTEGSNYPEALAVLTQIGRTMNALGQKANDAGRSIAS
jgi:hypothetical protein